jgi:hypothetical protein
MSCICHDCETEFQMTTDTWDFEYDDKNFCSSKCMFEYIRCTCPNCLCKQCECENNEEYDFTENFCEECQCFTCCCPDVVYYSYDSEAFA